MMIEEFSSGWKVVDQHPSFGEHMLHEDGSVIFLDVSEWCLVSHPSWGPERSMSAKMWLKDVIEIAPSFKSWAIRQVIRSIENENARMKKVLLDAIKSINDGEAEIANILLDELIHWHAADLVRDLRSIQNESSADKYDRLMKSAKYANKKGLNDWAHELEKESRVHFSEDPERED